MASTRASTRASGPERQRRRLTQRLLRRRRAEQDPAAWNDGSGSRDDVAAGPDRRGGERPGHRRHRAERQARRSCRARRHQGDGGFFLADAVICSFRMGRRRGSRRRQRRLLAGQRALRRERPRSAAADQPLSATIIRALTRAVAYARRRGASPWCASAERRVNLDGPALNGCRRLPRAGLPDVVTVSSIGLNGTGLAVGTPSDSGLGEIDLDGAPVATSQGAPPPASCCGPGRPRCRSPARLWSHARARTLRATASLRARPQAAAQVSGVAALVVSRISARELVVGREDRNRTHVPGRFPPRRADSALPCPAADARSVSNGNENGFFGKGWSTRPRRPRRRAPPSPRTRMLGRGRHAALTAAIRCSIEAFASPKSIAVFGS